MPWCYTIPDIFQAALPVHLDSYNWNRKTMAVGLQRQEPCLISKCEGFSDENLVTIDGEKCTFNTIDPRYSTDKYPVYKNTCQKPTHSNRHEWDIDWDTYQKFTPKYCYVNFWKGKFRVGGEKHWAGGSCHSMCPKFYKYCAVNALYRGCTGESFKIA
mgnify:CR=1 FL=1